MTPELEKRLNDAHAKGFQRILSFEARGGGFGLYPGRRPNALLTSYGTMYLSELAKVYDFDTSVLDRSIKWLEQIQDAQGRWRGSDPHQQWRRISDAAIPSTAYTAWALRVAGREDSIPFQRAAAFLRKADIDDPYAFALITMALPTKENLDALAKMSKDGVWKTQLQSWNNGRGRAADIETTALAVRALANHAPQLADRGAEWLIQSKGPHGAWRSTQATVLALQALTAVGGGAPGKKADVKITVNGTEVANETIEGGIEYRTFDISPRLRGGKNEITLETSMKVNVQVTGRYYVPWGTQDLIGDTEGLNINVEYDRTEAKVGETVTCSVKVEADTFMVIADVAVPPGFTVDRSDLDALVQKGTVDKVSQTGRTLTFYLAGKSVSFSYKLKPRYPVEVSVPRSVVYEYYTPDRRVISPPQTLIIR